MTYRSTDNTAARQPIVSVVVCTHNVEDWVEETLNGVLTQTCGPDPIEVLVVDSSDDATPLRAAALLQKHPVAFQVLTVENKGPSHARNIGWRRARGEWVQFLDGDDLLHPTKLEVQMAAIDSAGDAAVMYSDWTRCRLTRKGWQCDRSVESPSVHADPVAELLQASNFIATGSQLFHRRWLERVSGCNEDYWFIEDVDLMLRIAMSGGVFRAVPSATPLFFYRQRIHESLAQRSRRDFVEGCVRNAKLAEAYWTARSDLTVPHRRLLAGIYVQGARYYASEDQKQFLTLVADIESLVPGFVPEAPARLKYLSRLLGYRRAEMSAVTFRRLKARSWRRPSSTSDATATS
jgi:glycosyltransferase involved in cell wall biosynthesis